MKKNLNKTLRILHRDIGYFIVGLVILYAVSGVALNHRRSWNPTTRVISTIDFVEGDLIAKDSITADYTLNLIEKFGYRKEFNRYFIRKNNLIVQFDGGRLTMNVKNGEGKVELTRKQHVFNQFIFLHRTSNNWWIYFSDLFSLFLIFLAISGLILVKGEKGFKWRGLFLGLIGIIIPVILYIII